MQANHQTQTHQPILPDDFITLAQAARIIPSRSGRKLAPSTVYRWGRRGKITLYEANGLKVSLSEIRHKFGVRRVEQGVSRGVAVRSGGRVSR